MDLTLILFLLMGFLAVVLALEALYNLWASRSSAEARRIASRLSTLEGLDDEAALSIERSAPRGRMPGLAAWVGRNEWGRRLDLLVGSSGMQSSATELILLSAALGGVGLLGTLLIHRPLLLAAGIGALAAASPWIQVLRRRAARIDLFDRQFPDALDLMGRALRAGHALPVAIRMCGEELPDPIRREFRLLADETTYGVPLHDALQNMARRVPVPDIPYFAAAVLIQRETGGNMAELLDNIGSLVRQRMKLRGQIRTMSAEGRLSAWILSLLPVVAATLLTLVNPEHMAPLWHEPLGQTLVGGAVLMIGVGIVWMRRVVHIRV